MQYVVYHDGKAAKFCCSPCQNAYIMKNRKIVPCGWCKVAQHISYSTKRSIIFPVWLNSKQCFAHRVTKLVGWNLLLT